MYYAHIYVQIVDNILHQFVQILNSKLGYHLSRQEAEKMTFNDFLNGKNHEIFNSAFEDFKNGWNAIIPNVNQYQCHELSNNKPIINHKSINTYKVRLKYLKR